jgi:hypothetical protein
VSSLLQFYHAFFYAGREIRHDILHPLLQLEELLSSGFLDLRDLSEYENVLIDPEMSVVSKIL